MTKLMFKQTDEEKAAAEERKKARAERMAAYAASQEEPPPQPIQRRKYVKPAPKPAYVDDLALILPGRPEKGITVGPERDVPVDVDALAFNDGATTRYRVPKSVGVPWQTYKAAVPGPRGAAEIDAWFVKRGVHTIAADDGSIGYWTEDGGRLLANLREAWQACVPILKPYKHGTKPRCVLPGHVGAPAEAMTISGGALWCGACEPPATEKRKTA